MDARADKYLFVGYPRDSIGYLFYHPTEQKVFVSRHATFLEKEFILQKGSRRNIELKEVQQLDISQPNHDIISIEPEHTTPIHRSDRVHHAPKRYGFIVENNEAQIIENDEPLTYTDAVVSRDSDRWLEAMRSEIDSMYVNQVWTLVDAPEGVSPIGCKWVYKKKIGADGQVKTYKARLVAKGFK